MVATMIPSAFAAEGDPVHQDLKITVDTYSATQTENGDYTVTVWDSNDVTINWAPIPGTTLKLVTGGKNPNVVLDLPHKLYLAENAKIEEGGNVYSVTLREKKGSTEVDHKLTITVESTIPDNNATLKAVRVDNTKGNYKFGYLDGMTVIPGYIADVKSTGVEAHAVNGEPNNGDETVTITLPFGMTPGDVGFAPANNALTTFTLTEKVFAPTSVHATALYEWKGMKDSTVTVTAATGAKNIYKVIFKQEKIFDSFANNITPLADLEKVPETGKLTTLKVESGAKFVPVYEDTDNVKRIMGTSGNAEASTTVDTNVKLLWVNNADNQGEGLSVNGTGVADGDDMLKLITSGHASWAVTHTASGPIQAKDLVYLLVRTAANPTGAWLKIDLDAPVAPKTKAHITMVQADNVAETATVGEDDRLISLVVDHQHRMGAELGAGNTEPRRDDDPATGCYLHVKTDEPAWVEIPNQKMAPTAIDKAQGDGWWSTTSKVASSTGSRDHFIDGINAKSGEFTLRVWSEDETYIDYTVRLTAAQADYLGIQRVELRSADGSFVQASTAGATVGTPFEIEIPYIYHASQRLSDAITSDADLQALQLWVYTDDGAVVVPGNDNVGVIDDENRVNATNKIGRPICNQVTQTNLQPDANPAFVGGENTKTPISNGWTTLGNVWTNEFTLSSAGVTNTNGTNSATFDSILNLTVTNGTNESAAVYQVKLKRAEPLQTAEITDVKANKALDDDYLFSVATTLGKQIGFSEDIGQAFAGAIDDEGNELDVDVDSVNKAIKIQVPYDWDEDEDTLYLTGITWAGHKLYRAANSIAYNGKVTKTNKVTEFRDTDNAITIDTIEQDDQTESGTTPMAHYLVGFTELTTSPSSAKDENVLYVYSEKDMYPNPNATAVTPTSLGNLKASTAKAYRVYIEKVGSANTGRTLNDVTSESVSAKFNPTYNTIAVTVPSSYNWNSYRANNSQDFKLHFDTSAGAMVIDKGQYEANEKIAQNSVKSTPPNASKYDDARNGTTTGVDGAPLKDASEAKYKKQLNEYYDINDATFFVLDGELYVYDELSGKQTRVTGVGKKFTNSNWGEIKTKQAEIRVYNEAQQSSLTYRLDLKVGEPSNEKDILSLKVGDVTATRSGNSFTAALAEDAEKEQALTLQLSDMATAMVNGQPYQADRKIDVSKEVTIVVTAENGSKTNYSLTTTFGTVTPPDPDKKPSDNYTDIPSGTIGEYVKKGIDLGIMIGSGNKFLPDNKITRRDFALMVARADVMAKDPSIKTAEAAQAELLKQYSGTPKFDDTKKLTDIYNAAIEYCNKKDIISGKPGNKFDPAGNVTRLETARMISGWAEVTDESKTTNVNNIKDWNKINWGKQYVNSVYAAGLMSGYGDASNSSFRPAQNLTRAEAARVIVSTFEKKTGAN
jgi:hypothetical protein